MIIRRTFLLLGLIACIPALAQRETVSVSILRSQEIPILMERSQRELALEQDSRGLLAMGIDMTAQFGTKALTGVLAKAKGRYSSEWKAPICRDHFYESPSMLGPLDPTGLQFSGFSLSRNVTNPDETTSQALFLSCSLPTDNLTDFIVNHRFNLRLDTLSVDLSKIHAKYKTDKRVSLEINIVIKATWMDQNLKVLQDQQIGVFRILLPGLKYDKNAPVYTISGASAADKISGYSFFVPRSYSAFKTGEKYVSCWGTGEFEIEVSVKEVTGKAAVVTEYLYDSLGKNLPSAILSIVTNKQVVGSEVAEIIKTY